MMNPGVSLHLTGVLPRRFARSYSVSKLVSLIFSVLGTSTSFITGTGLKKCSPPNRVLRSGDTLAAISEISRPEVLLAKIASCGARESSDANRSCFADNFSTMASSTT